MSTMKRTLVSVAAALAVASTSAVAQGVKMSDKQLDQVTAAGARSLVLISNPGNASVGHNLSFQSGNHATCINCSEASAILPPNEGRAAGAVHLMNRKFMDNPKRHCVGQGIPGFC